VLRKMAAPILSSLVRIVAVQARSSLVPLSARRHRVQLSPLLGWHATEFENSDFDSGLLTDIESSRKKLP